MKTVRYGHTYQPINTHHTKLNPNKQQANPSLKASNFAEHLNSALKPLQQPIQTEQLKFSQHAKLRLAERGIEVSEDLLKQLEEGVSKASLKGAKESLLITQDFAFVVSIKNRTVITAMENGQMEDQVITNIDSAVLLN